MNCLCESAKPLLSIQRKFETLRYVPAAFTTFGGWGGVMLKKLKKEYAEKRLAEKKEGGTGWKAQRWKQDILERASISIAKSNYEMLRCHCTAPYA